MDAEHVASTHFCVPTQSAHAREQNERFMEILTKDDPPLLDEPRFVPIVQDTAEGGRARVGEPDPGTRVCGWCGDVTSNSRAHDCWVQAKIKSQENLMPPQSEYVLSNTVVRRDDGAQVPAPPPYISDTSYRTYSFEPAESGPASVISDQA